MRKLHGQISNLKRILLAGLVGASAFLGGCTHYIKLREIRVKVEQSPTDKTEIKEIALGNTQGFLDMFHPSLVKPIKVEKLILQKIPKDPAKKHLPYVVPYPITKFPNKLESFLNEDFQSYFPIAQENSWTYLRTVKGKELFYAVSFEKRNKKMFITSDSSQQSLDTELTEETYTILEKTREGFQQVKYETNRLNENGTRSDNKDLKYKGLGYHDFGVLERNERESDNLENIELRWKAMLNPDIIVGYEIPGMKYSPFEMGTTRHKETVTVVAGKFSDVLKCVTILNGTNLDEVLLENKSPKYIDNEGKDANRLPFKRFTTESYFAKGIGLVKEIQYNAKGEETYRLELKSYNVK